MVITNPTHYSIALKYDRPLGAPVCVAKGVDALALKIREVAKKLRQERIPSDVIHIDTDWTEVPHRCDFEFSHSRFEEPEKMLSDLKESGFRVSLWQLPYLNPKNELHEEVT